MEYRTPQFACESLIKTLRGKGISDERVLEAFPSLAPMVRRIEAGRPDSFLGAFDALDRALAEAGGPPGGRVLGVRRAAP